MANFAYSDNSLYTQIVSELGARGLSADKKLAVKNAIQESLITLTHTRAWSWRRRRTDMTFTAATPYYILPDDFDSMVSREICREESSDQTVQTLVERSDRDFWRMNAGADPGVPACFRTVHRTTGSTQWYCVETSPPADRDYTWPDTEYWATAPVLTYLAGTPVTPVMPPEFQTIWKSMAAANAAGALGRWKAKAILQRSADAALTDAVEQFDNLYPTGPAKGVEDAYGDWGAHL